MPIPKPKKGEKEEDFISRCASEMADIHPEMENDQRLAICYTSWREKEEAMKEGMFDVTADFAYADPDMKHQYRPGSDLVYIATDDSRYPTTHLFWNNVQDEFWGYDIRTGNSIPYKTSIDLPPKLKLMLQQFGQGIMENKDMKESKVTRQSHIPNLNSQQNLAIFDRQSSSEFVISQLIPAVNRFIVNYNNGLEANFAFSEACQNVNLDGERMDIKMKRELVSDEISELFDITVEYVL